VNEKIFSVSVELFGSADALGSRASRPSLSQRAAARVRPKTGMDARRAEAELERRRADALLTACDLGLVDDVARLVAGGATFEATDKSGVRPMVFASARGHSGVVALLLSHGVDANDDDDLGRTALHFAAMHDRADVVRVLVGRKGTWVDALDSTDDTPLHLAARMAGNNPPVRVVRDSRKLRRSGGDSFRALRNKSRRDVAAGKRKRTRTRTRPLSFETTRGAGAVELRFSRARAGRGRRAALATRKRSGFG
jgi:hypothetical protein